jgi:hypothetical protein
MLRSPEGAFLPRRTRVATAYGWSSVVALGMSACAGLSGVAAGGTHSHDGILLLSLALWNLLPSLALATAGERVSQPDAPHGQRA